MKLHQCLPVAGQKHNRYCGPAALAAMTGMNTGEAAALLRKVSGKPSIRGCQTKDMVKALAHTGLEIWQQHFDKGKRPMIRQWLPQLDGRCVILVAGKHYWALNDDMYVDSFNRRPTPITQIRQPNARIESILILHDPNDSYSEED